MAKFTRIKVTAVFDCVVCDEQLDPSTALTATTVSEVAESMARQLHYAGSNFPGRVAAARPVVTMEVQPHG